jgi:hypothetical protein
MPKEFNEAEISRAIQMFALKNSETTGTLDLQDPNSGNNRKLILVSVGTSKGREGALYHSSAQFQDIMTGEMVDVFFDLQGLSDQVNVVNYGIVKKDNPPGNGFSNNQQQFQPPAQPNFFPGTVNQGQVNQNNPVVPGTNNPQEDIRK